MSSQAPSYRGYRFPSEIISHAVWLVLPCAAASCREDDGRPVEVGKISATMRIYLDHNATTPVDPRVVDAVTGVLRDQFGNASSVHTFGQAAKSCVDDARSAVATLLGARPQEVVFTSGGTEADNLAIRGVADAHALTTCGWRITTQARNPVSVSSFVILGEVARMCRCATCSSCSST